MYRLDENPLPRFPENRPLEADRGKWKVAYLKSRREKQFAVDLMRKGISYYLPLYVKAIRRKDNGKQRKSVLPLFPGYMAFACGPEVLRGLHGQEDLVSVINIIDQEKFMRELDQVKTLLDRNVALRPRNGITPGARIKVLAGALEGLEGIVIKEENETRFVVNVEMFGQSVSAKIDEADLSRPGTP
jgi:hypothetical protein